MRSLEKETALLLEALDNKAKKKNTRTRQHLTIKEFLT